jgi:endonuclease/exonuclease/phosphatase family metal-dependent hydrolase
MKILTLNTWNTRGPWKERWEIIFKGLELLRPDVAAFQEVLDKKWAEEVKARTGFENLVFPENGSGLMMLSHYPVTEWKYKTLATQSPTEDYKRFVLYAKLEAGSRSLSLFNTHLSWQLSEGEIREHQVGELIAFSKQHAGGKEPAFFTVSMHPLKHLKCGA